MLKESSSGASLAATPDSSTARQYIVPLLTPGASGSPYFDGTRVTDFLGQYNNMCDDAGLSEISRVRHLTRYCGSDTGRYLYTLPEYRSELWKELQDLMMKEYRDQDPVQHQQSIQYLERLKNSKMKSVKQYCRVFKTTADAVLKKKQITEYQCCLWFLQGLPESLAAKLMRKHGVDIEEPESVKFKQLHESATKYVVEDEQLAALKRTGWESTRDPLEAFAAPSIIPPVPSAATSPAGKMPVERARQQPLLEGYEDDLSEQLRKMMIKVVRGMQEGIGEDGRGRGFGNSELRNGQRGSGTITPAGLDPARNINNQRGGSPVSCFFCGTAGHVTTRCFTLGDYIRSGKMHRGQDGKYVLGPEGQGGVAIPMDRTRPTKEVVDEMLPESMVSNSTIRSIRMDIVENDTEEEEEEDEEDDGLGSKEFLVRAARADGKGKQATRDRMQGPKLDAGRRVMKDRQAKELTLPSTKSMRSGTYRGDVLLQNVEEEIPESAGSSQTAQPDGVVKKLQDADIEMVDKVVRTKPRKTVAFEEAQNNQKLTRALAQVKNAGAQRLADAVLKRDVLVSVEDLLSGSSDVRRLIFSAKAWDHDDQVVHHRIEAPRV
jgi:hypothetical protein